VLPAGMHCSFRLTPSAVAGARACTAVESSCAALTGVCAPTSEIAITVTGQRQSGAGPPAMLLVVGGPLNEGAPCCFACRSHRPRLRSPVTQTPAAKLVRSGQGPGGTRGKMTELSPLLSARRSFFHALTSELCHGSLALLSARRAHKPCPPFAAYLSILA
jgi:hypothetical protein